jgi:hypothetical protein
MAEHEINREADRQPIAKTLWADPDRARQFLIPDAVDLPPGDFRLRTATGVEAHVDPAALAPFEVSAEEARVWAKEQLKDVARRLRASFKDRPGGSARGEGDREAGQGPRDDAGQARPTPGLDLLADITSTPRDRLTGDYRAVGRALRDYFKDIKDTAGEAMSGDPRREQSARERMRSWAETLKAHGVGVADAAPDDDSGSPRGDQADAPAIGLEPASGPARAQPAAEGAQRAGAADRGAGSHGGETAREGREQDSAPGPRESAGGDAADDATRTAETLKAFADDLEGLAAKAARSIRKLAAEVEDPSAPRSSAADDPDAKR